MADVFISYSRSDRQVAEQLAAALEAQGISYWMDSHLTGGSTFTEVTETELNGAGKVVVLWSENSIKSGWVCDEAQAAREQGKLVPLAIDGSLPPMGFRQIQTLDVAEWAKGQNASMPTGLADALAISLPGAMPVELPTTKLAWTRRRTNVALILATLIALAATFWAFGWGSIYGSSDERQITVMPFEAVGSDERTEILATGITEELIVRLRRIAELKVISGLGGSDPAGNRLLGTIRRDGDRLRISARLEGNGGNVMWSENFDRKVNDLLLVQEEIATAIADALSVSLDVGINSRDFGGTDNPEAYRNYVEAISNRLRADGDLDYSISNFERAIELDPNYVRALSQLTLVLGGELSGTEQGPAATQIVARMDDLSARALNAAPNLWLGHAARGWYFFAAGDIAAAEKEFDRVSELDNGADPELRDALADYHMALGRIRKASRIRESKALIDPVFAMDDIDRHLDDLYLGNYSMVLERVERWEQRGVQHTGAPYIRATFASLALGDRTLADAYLEKAKGLGFSPLPRSVPTLADVAADGTFMPTSGERSAVHAWLAKIGKPNRNTASVALWAAYLGRDDIPMPVLEVAYEAPGLPGYYEPWIWHPLLSNVRRTDRFVQLVEKLGLVRVWRDSGDWGDFCEPISETKIACH